MIYLTIGLFVTWIKTMMFIYERYHNHIIPKPEWFWFVMLDIISNVVLWPVNVAIRIMRITRPEFNKFVIETTKQFYEDKES